MAVEIALITGATSGIGKATATLLHERGVRLILVGRQKDELEKLQKLLNAEIVQADLGQEEGRNKVVAIIKKELPDIVINNAGFGLYGEALSFTTEQQLEIVDVNGRAALEITLEAAHALKDGKKRGVILNVSSAAAFQIFPLMAIYSASKAFVNHFSQSLDFEFQKNGIRVLTLCPGMVDTNFQYRAGGAIDGKMRGVMSPAFVAEMIWKQIKSQNPLLIIDWKVRFLTCLSRILPVSWTARILENIIKNRIQR